MDTSMIFTLSAVTLLLVLLAVVILAGKGDWLIAGYNTAKEKDRQQFNMKRLRAIVSGLLLTTVVFIWLVPLIGETATQWSLLVLFGIYFIGIYLANTWCKKK